MERAIRYAAPRKAPGIDGIPNLVLQHHLDILAPHFLALFRACLRIGHSPEHFQKSRTVILKKAGKANYVDPKAYRPIALLSTIGKAIESIVALRLSWLAEHHQLLPTNHFGGRKNLSSEHALHILMDRVHAA